MRVRLNPLYEHPNIGLASPIDPERLPAAERVNIRVRHRAIFWGALALGLVGLLIIGGSLALNIYVERLGRSPLAFAVAAEGVVFFLGVLMLGHFTALETGRAESAMRHAIAAGFFASYVTLLGLYSFIEEFTQAELARTLVNNFTYLMGIIVAFYFGSTALVEYGKSKERAAEKTNQ